MVIIYIIAGMGVLIGLAALGIYIHRAARAQGKLESNNDCDKRILELGTRLAKKIYGSVDDINAGLNIKLPLSKDETRDPEA